MNVFICLNLTAIRGWQIRREVQQRKLAAEVIQRSFRQYRAKQQQQQYQQQQWVLTHLDLQTETERDVSEHDSVSQNVQNVVHNDIHFGAVHAKSTQRLPSATCGTISSEKTSDIVHFQPFEHSLSKDPQTLSRVTFHTEDTFSSTLFKHKDGFHNVAAAMTAAFLTQKRFQLSGAFSGIPYLEAQNCVVSRRRMPRVRFFPFPCNWILVLIN